MYGWNDERGREWARMGREFNWAMGAYDTIFVYGMNIEIRVPNFTLLIVCEHESWCSDSLIAPYASTSKAEKERHPNHFALRIHKMTTQRLSEPITCSDNILYAVIVPFGCFIELWKCVNRNTVSNLKLIKLLIECDEFQGHVNTGNRREY